MRNAPVALINSTAASGTITSNGVYLGNVINYSVHMIAASGGTGSIVLQVSNDNVPVQYGTNANPSASVVNWTPIASGTIAVSGTGASMVNFVDCGYAWLRAVYTATGGTGAALNLNFFGKGA